MQNLDGAFFGVLQKIIMEYRVGRCGAAKGHAKIPFCDAAFLNLAGEKAFRLLSSGQQNKPAGTGVQTVAKNRMGGLPLGFQSGTDTVHQSILPVAVNRDTRRFVGNHQMFILIDQNSGWTSLILQFFIQNIQPYHIPVLYTGGKRLLFAVQFDFVFPQRLVEPSRRQGRELLHQIAVQPYRQKTVDAQLFHCVVSSLSQSIVASSISSVTISQPGSLSSTCMIR